MPITNYRSASAQATAKIKTLTAALAAAQQEAAAANARACRLQAENTKLKSTANPPYAMDFRLISPFNDLFPRPAALIPNVERDAKLANWQQEGQKFEEHAEECGIMWKIVEKEFKKLTVGLEEEKVDELLEEARRKAEKARNVEMEKK
jgi:hypothetical protein